MRTFLVKPLFYLGALIACTGVLSGCASGGYKLTRQYARFVNSQNLIVRIVLYILTSVVFLVTILVDVVINNTVDFWQGRVSAGSYEFKDADKIYQVRHEFAPGTKLKRSTIQIKDKDGVQIQEVALKEMTSGEIEVFVDGQIRGRVQGIGDIPVASIFDKNGKVTSKITIPLQPMVATGPSSQMVF